MSLACSTRALRRSFLFSLTLYLAAAGGVRAETPAAPAPAPRLRIKNAQSIRVALGTHRHEPASGIRPEKGVWNVMVTTDLTGASAELVDLTPDVARSRWVVDVQGDRLVLDAGRFLPSHVYQLDVRKEKRLIGSALVYLYSPPVERVGRVEFKDEETTNKGETAKKDDSGDLAAVPKGGL
jgi:hypothetical protein